MKSTVNDLNTYNVQQLSRILLQVYNVTTLSIRIVNGRLGFILFYSFWFLFGFFLFSILNLDKKILYYIIYDSYMLWSVTKLWHMSQVTGHMIM